jgi:hypothetical protein
MERHAGSDYADEDTHADLDLRHQPMQEESQASTHPHQEEIDEQIKHQESKYGESRALPLKIVCVSRQWQVSFFLSLELPYHSRAKNQRGSFLSQKEACKIRNSRVITVFVGAVSGQQSAINEKR